MTTVDANEMKGSGHGWQKPVFWSVCQRGSIQQCPNVAKMQKHRAGETPLCQGRCWKEEPEKNGRKLQDAKELHLVAITACT